MDGPDEVQFDPTDRVLVIISDSMIHGTTRLQKYGFILHKQYETELGRISQGGLSPGFYDDWEPYYYGPYSRQLDKDARMCVKNGLVVKKAINTTLNSFKYFFTIRGRVRWRRLFAKHQEDMTAVEEKIRKLQTVQLEDLMRNIYRVYPEYTTLSKIKGSLE